MQKPRKCQHSILDLTCLFVCRRRVIQPRKDYLKIADKPLDISNMKPSFLIRKSSCHSLVEIPTFMTSNILLKSVLQDSSYSLPYYETDTGISLVERLANYKPIIQEETQRRKQLLEKQMVCMATLFLVCCLVMVGTMFTVISQYQDMVIANMINMTNHYDKLVKEVK